MTERSASTNGPGCDPGPLSSPALKQLRFHGRLLRFGDRFKRGHVSCELIRACVDTARLAGHRVQRERNRLRQPSPLKGAFVGKPECLPQALTAHSRVGVRGLSLVHGVLVGCDDSRLIAPCGAHCHNPGIIRRFPTPKRRMRIADDLAYRARNWFWYWQVRQVSQLSNQQLDEKAFGDVGRKRHFERIQHAASSPDSVALFDGLTLVELVDGWTMPGTGGDRPLATATSAFRSHLWDFLTRRDIAPREYTDFIQSVVAERGWHRIHGRDLGLYRRFLGPAEPAGGSSGGDVYSAMLHRLANDASPDSLAVLIALFREAMHAVRLQEALLIKSAIGAATVWMCSQLQMPEIVTRLLDRLIEDRVLSNLWVTEADWRAQTAHRAGNAKNSRDRLWEFRDWVHWYIEDCPKLVDAGYCASPIVPSSPRIDWLESNRGALEGIHRTLCDGGDRFQYRLSDANHKLAEEWLAGPEFTTRVAQELNCPCEPSPRFFASSPSLEIGFLPRAY